MLKQRDTRMKFRLSQIADWLGAEASATDQEVVGYSIDTRTIRAGELFFAIRGSRRDGHDYVAAAFERGACAAVVRSAGKAANEAAGRTLVVGSPLQALGELAARARHRWGQRLVAVTGSNGKTTTKELIATVLKTKYQVAKSAGNLNNELGLPLSLLRFDETAEVGVVEMGMNHSGEIRRLAGIAAPTVGVVTTVNAVHLENFSSVDEIASAKQELVEELRLEGTAVLNGDDPRVAAFQEVCPCPSITFGFNAQADFRAVDVESFGAKGVRFRLGAGGPRFDIALPGRHNVSNILAALATASVFGVDAKEARDAIAGFQQPSMRGDVREIGGAVVINDCYNSNPKALSEMLTVLRETPASRRVAVIGEMLELGSGSAAMHYELGSKFVESGADLLISVGGWAREIVAGAVGNGFSPDSAFHFDDATSAGSFLAEVVAVGDAVLLKGSRGVGLERALDALKRRLGKAEGE